MSKVTTMEELFMEELRDLYDAETQLTKALPKMAKAATSEELRNAFEEHLGQTENLNPAEWSSEELPSELTKALARVDQAKAIYSQSRARLLALRQSEEAQGEDIPADLMPEPTAPYAEKSIGAMMREGFFYSFIPLGLISIFLLLAYIVLHSH